MDTREDRHTDDGALLALLDGELDAEERRRVEAHTKRCSECAGRSEELRFAARRLTATLEADDVPSPWVEMPAALRQAYQDAPTPIASARSARAGWVGRHSVATAAGLTLLLAAGAYAFPGSPVRQWVGDGIGSIAALITDDDDAPAEPGLSGVSVEPAGGTVRVSVLDATPGLRVTISLSDDSSAAATASGASFRVESGLIEVSEASDELNISLPRAVTSGSVEVDGIEVARLDGGELRRTEAAETSSAEIVVQSGG